VRGQRRSSPTDPARDTVADGATSRGRHAACRQPGAGLGRVPEQQYRVPEGQGAGAQRQDTQPVGGRAHVGQQQRRRFPEPERRHRGGRSRGCCGRRRRGHGVRRWPSVSRLRRQRQQRARREPPSATGGWLRHNGHVFRHVVVALLIGQSPS